MQTEVRQDPCAGQRGPMHDRAEAKAEGRQLSPPPPVRVAMTAIFESDRLAEHLVDMFPVDEMLEERLQVIRTAVAVIDVIGVLPDVAAEDRGRTMHQRVFAVGRLGDFELAT